MKKYCKGWEDYFGSSQWLLSDIEKYGKHNFTRTIIEECETLKKLQQREIYHLETNDVLNEENNFYNLSIPHIEFRKKRNTHSNKGRTWNEIYGPEYAAKKREMLSRRTKNKTWTQLYGADKADQIRKAYSRPRTQEMCQNISKGRKGIIFTPQHRENLRQARLRYIATISNSTDKDKNW